MNFSIRRLFISFKLFIIFILPSVACCKPDTKNVLCTKNENKGNFVVNELLFVLLRVKCNNEREKRFQS